MSDPSEPRPVDGAPEVDAAAAALARARAAARAKGLRPGSKPARRRSGSPAGERPVDRDPHLLGEEVDAFIAERGWGVDVAVGSVVARWSRIVGPEVAAHAEPVEFVDGVLSVRADSTAWATQLRLLEATLLARLAEDVGEGTVSALRVLGPGGPSWSKGPRRAQDGRGPRDTYG